MGLHHLFVLVCVAVSATVDAQDGVGSPPSVVPPPTATCTGDDDVWTCQDPCRAPRTTVILFVVGPVLDFNCLDTPKLKVGMIIVLKKKYDTQRKFG